MICKAKSLQKVANQLASNQYPVQSDSFMFDGKIIAAPILLALATEIALKAWQCRERQGTPDHSHDLLKLFEGLSEDAQTRLEEELPVQLDPISIHLGVHDVCPVGARVRNVLEFHRRSFERCRYSYESMAEVFYLPALNEALTVIIDTYNRTLAESA